MGREQKDSGRILIVLALGAWAAIAVLACDPFPQNMLVASAAIGVVAAAGFIGGVSGC